MPIQTISYFLDWEILFEKQDGWTFRAQHPQCVGDLVNGVSHESFEDAYNEAIRLIQIYQIQASSGDLLDELQRSNQITQERYIAGFTLVSQLVATLSPPEG